VRTQALAAFFSPGAAHSHGKPLICKEMAENKPFARYFPVNIL
jgi:hypothetical protein